MLVPQIGRLVRGRFLVFDMSAGYIGLGEFDLANQTSIRHHVWIDENNAEVFDSKRRIALPPDTTPWHHWRASKWISGRRNWQRKPCTRHVSVWRLP
jgi:hypothetical protein